jgi:hypothetical protein
MISLIVISGDFSRSKKKEGERDPTTNTGLRRVQGLVWSNLARSKKHHEWKGEG